MVQIRDRNAVQTIQDIHHPLSGDQVDYDPLIENIGDARIVLIGEATDGTHEFYRRRAEITRRLIEERGFTIVAVEADWPDAYRVNAYVRGVSDDPGAREALGEFQRFPTWMWRNTVVLEFVEWLRAYNDSLEAEKPKTGFYGMDLYSLSRSVQAVIDYLDKVDPEAALRARERYSCFEQFEHDSIAYGRATAMGAKEPCEDAVVEQLIELQTRATDLALRDGRVAEDEFFYASQNARLVTNAERYYRMMFRGRVSSWNLRDEHMADTLDALIGHYRARHPDTKVVIWAHNSHIGDASATEMGWQGEWNVGQLMRERHTVDTRLIGLTTHHGTVTAASNWDGPGERKHVRPSLANSYENLFHQADVGDFLLTFDECEGTSGPWDIRLERAIGVIYRPEHERASHYFRARLPQQFDAVLHFDETQALEPLEPEPGWHTDDAPETYPFTT
jgi:erythromycin esterase-like protein